MTKLFLKIGITLICCFGVFAAYSAEQQPAVSILFPRDHAIVGRKVNLVLDPTTDWSSVPFFQVAVNNSEYAAIDTSSGRHANQGLSMDQGSNTITVKVLFPSADKEKKGFLVVSSQTITVFNREGNFSTIPEGFSREPFHIREQEAGCSGCHRLEVTPEDINHKKPEDVLCYACHREIPVGMHIHGPSAVWNCLGCHNPDIYPVKYQFTAADPWKVSKTTQVVEPAVFTLSNDALFKPGTATLIFTKPEDKTRKKGKGKGKDKEKVIDEKDKEPDKNKELLRTVLEYIQLNPTDKIRIEAHTDNTPLKNEKKKDKGKKAKGFKNNKALTDARAAVMASLLKQYGVTGKNRVLAAGMGDKLPKAPNTTRDGRALNNRIELVVYPAEVKIVNSMKLPTINDRERVLVNIAYANGPALKKLKLLEKLPKGTQYVKGSGFFKGAVKEPQIKGDDLVWQIGDMDTDFSEALSYVVRKTKNPGTISSAIRVGYVANKQEMSREFDPQTPSKRGYTVKETCMKCHGNIVSGPFKHGPVDAGYCNLCHDPHASHNPAWLRKSSWELCTTCHAEKASGVHVVAGFVSGFSHPTKDKRDPARPGKRLSCASCHAPHSAETHDLFAYDVKSRYDLCGICHNKK